MGFFTSFCKSLFSLLFSALFILNEYFEKLQSYETLKINCKITTKNCFEKVDKIMHG